MSIARNTWFLVTEDRRTYHYSDGKRVVFDDVHLLRVSESGTHYLDYGDKQKAIVAPGWLWIEIEAKAWSV